MPDYSSVTTTKEYFINIFVLFLKLKNNFFIKKQTPNYEFLCLPFRFELVNTHSCLNKNKNHHNLAID